MKIGLVLSGGGVRGLAHIGAIKALEEHGIYPSYIAGTSAGAIVGALYAKGYTWQEILDFFKSTEIFSMNNYAKGKPGFLDTDKFYHQFKKYFLHDTFDSLQKPLYITATNLLDGMLKVFHRGELIKPLLASAAVPGLFAPVEIENGYYIDGGILNNFPVDLIKLYCDRIIGVYVNPFEKVRKIDLKHVHNVMERAYHIMVANETVSKFADCDVLIRPRNMGDFNLFSLKNMDAIFDLGYTAAKETLSQSIVLQTESILAAEFEAMNGFPI